MIDLLRMCKRLKTPKLESLADKMVTFGDSSDKKKPLFWTWMRPCSMPNSFHKVRNWEMMMIVILYAICRLRVEDQIQ